MSANDEWSFLASSPVSTSVPALRERKGIDAILVVGKDSEHALQLLTEKVNLLSSVALEDLANKIKENLNKPIAILCTRYVYRGILTEVGKGFIVISKARTVEVTGPCSAEKPQFEDDIGGSIIVPFHNIELIYHPKWESWEL